MANETGSTRGATRSNSADASGASNPQGQNGQQGGQQSAAGKIQDIAEQAQQTATEQVESRVNSAKSSAAGALHSIAQSLLSSGEQLRNEDQPGIAGYADQAGNKLEQLSHFLEGASSGDIVNRVEDFARREPALFLGSVFAVGFLGARFLKSSQRSQGQEGTRASYVQQPSRAPKGSSRSSGNGEPRLSSFDREVTAPPQREWPGGVANQMGTRGGGSSDENFGRS